MQRMRVVLVLAVVLAPLGSPSHAASDPFWSFWGDNKAELDGYALTEPRYGELRQGTAVLIFVTEDFSDSARVKADPGKHPPSDVYPVMKVNVVRDFQTGIYDYNTMTSTFLKTEFGSGAYWPLAKTSFSAQEWCGHVYAQWLPRGDRLVGTLHSYFDGEADATPTLPLPPGGIVEDALPILVRGLRGDWLQPGESRTLPYLRALQRTRFAHQPAAWGEATVTRAPAAAEVKTALGTLRAFTYTVAERNGETTTFTVEEAAPHRLLGWHASGGETARILGSVRLPYWDLHRNGDEQLLQKLGLKAQVPPRAR